MIDKSQLQLEKAVVYHEGRFPPGERNSLADYEGVSLGFGWVFRVSLFFVLVFCQ